jgi:uncharacterized iron-regulated protein
LRSLESRLISSTLLVVAFCQAQVCVAQAITTQPSSPEVVAAPTTPLAPTMFAGSTGKKYSWAQLLDAMDNADVIIMGEQHTDGRGHTIQTEIIAAAGERWSGLTLSLEEFDRSQQAELSAYQHGEITAPELKAVRNFVMPAVRDNWMEWNLPKLEAALQTQSSLLASNAPLKYSRLVRNVGCDKLPELAPKERGLFECPSVPEDPAYKARFVRNLKASIGRNKPAGMKPLGEAQTDRMFRALRVWDATMAASIVQARADGANKVLHVVGSQHSDFDGGLVQELRQRDPDSRLLVIYLGPRRAAKMAATDRGRADVIIYTRSQ